MSTSADGPVTLNPDDYQRDVPLQPDEDEEAEDSTLGTEDRSSLTQSLRTSLLESVQENGRNYHRYKSTAGANYFLPEDELEQDRLDLQHEMFLFTFNGKLFNSPIQPDKITDVLDLGTGTGVWAIDFADEHPNVQVIGTDLSPIQPQYVPPNCKFEIDDFNSEWTFGQKFDYIHARGLAGASTDYPALMRQAYDALKPGGWLEMPDIYVPFHDIDGTMKNTKQEYWGQTQYEAALKFGLDTKGAKNYKQWMIDSGFENVTELQYKWPLGTWPRDPKAKYLGKLTMVNTLSGLEGFSLRLWTAGLGMSYEQVLLDLAAVRKDIANPKIHAYWPMYTVYGQKPDKS